MSTRSSVNALANQANRLTFACAVAHAHAAVIDYSFIKVISAANHAKHELVQSLDPVIKMW